MYYFRPRQPIDLISVVEHHRVSEYVSYFVTHMHELHKIISDKIKQSNLDYKLQANARRIFKTFDVGDLVMVRIRPERFPPGTVNAPIPRVRRRYFDVYMQVKNTLMYIR